MTQESEETGTFLINEEVLSKSKRVHDEVCKYLTQFDDGNDQDVTEVCNPKNKLTNTQKQQKLEKYLTGLITEYQECE